MHKYVNPCMLLEGEIGLAQHQEGQKRVKLIQRYKHVHLMCAYVRQLVRAHSSSSSSIYSQPIRLSAIESSSRYQTQLVRAHSSSSSSIYSQPIRLSAIESSSRYQTQLVRALMRVNSRAHPTCIHVYTCPPGTNTSRSCRRHISRRSATTSTT